MLKFFGLACTNKKDKNKLALTAGPSGSSSSTTIQITRGPSSEVEIDESLNQSVAIPQSAHRNLNTSQFVANVISDVSLDAAALQNRATPIDFGTREVKADEDVLSVAGRRRSLNTITPSPIPEETEDNLTDKNMYSPMASTSGNEIFEPRNRYYTPRLIKVRKQARVYNSNDSSASASSSFSSNQDESHRIDSIRVRASKSATNNLLKGRLTPVLGGSLRPLRAKRHSIAFDGNRTFAALGRRRPENHLERCSLGERLMLRTRSTGGSVRETLSKAIRSTLGRTSSVERKGMPDYPKFGTALTSTTSSSPKDKSSDSGDGESPSHRKYSNKDCARIYFSSTSSEHSSRSNSSTPRRVRHTTSSSGYGSLSHLPPLMHRKSQDPLNSLMSQSMYVQSSGCISDERRPTSLSHRKLYYEDSSETYIPSSPSLTTLKDFMMTNDEDTFDEEFDYDNDDVKSVISSASTSRLFSIDCRMSKYQKNQSLRHFLNSPVRLRKRGDTSRRDAVEAGFEPRDAVPRCHSTQSLRDVQRVRSYTNSQFQASDLSLNPNGSVRAACDSTSGNVIAPTAIVNPAQQITGRQNHIHPSRQHHMSYDKDLNPHHNIDVDRRRSLQALNGSSALYQLSNGSPSGGRSQFSPSDLAVNAPIHHVGSRVRVASVNQICDSSSAPQYSIDQRRSVHNVGNPVRNSFVEGIKNTSTPKNQIAVAPLAHKSRHLSESRDEMRTERRGSGGAMNLPAYTNFLMRHPGEERLVDGPVNSASDARIAYLEKRIRELELTQKEQQSVHSTPNQSRHSSSKSSHFNGSTGMSTSEQIRVQEMSDELAMKERKVTSLESKLLKAYQKIERLNEDYQGKIKGLMYDSERARDDLTHCLSKIQQLESELDETRAAAQNGDHTNEQEYHELRDKIWKQERELQECRTLLTRLREKEADFERMRSEKGYLELKNENLNKKLEAKKRAVEELERSVSTLRLEQTICQQSCSSGSTPLADEMETMSDIRPSLARPYTKAHSTLGSNNMSPLSHSKSNGLTKSFSNFALNSSKQRDDITPMMSRSIREQNRHITMCKAMVVCLKDTVDRMARGENPDVARLLGVKLNMMSESEMDDEEDYEADESKPFSMMSAESALSKQCAKLADLDKDLDTIRCQLADWHGQTNAEGEGDRDVCRVQ